MVIANENGSGMRTGTERRSDQVQDQARGMARVLAQVGGIRVMPAVPLPAHPTASPLLATHPAVQGPSRRKWTGDIGIETGTTAHRLRREAVFGQDREERPAGRGQEQEGAGGGALITLGAEGKVLTIQREVGGGVSVGSQTRDRGLKGGASFS